MLKNKDKSFTYKSGTILSIIFFMKYLQIIDVAKHGRGNSWKKNKNKAIILFFVCIWLDLQ